MNPAKEQELNIVASHTCTSVQVAAMIKEK